MIGKVCGTANWPGAERLRFYRERKGTMTYTRRIAEKLNKWAKEKDTSFDKYDVKIISKLLVCNPDERMIAKVYCKGVVLNQSLLVSNLGTTDTRYCNNSEFAQESWASECN